MTAKVVARKAALKAQLLEIAEQRIAEGGLSALRARDLAKEAGCSVGAIYNVYEDLNALIMAVNGRTFRALGQAVGAAVAESGPMKPQDQLIVMSTAYLGYAAEHTRLWRALFDLEMSADGPVPNWYLKELAAVFGLIAVPLREIYPNKGPEDLDLMVRALFSSVHGIVLLGLEQRISGVPLGQIEKMIAAVLREIG